MTGVTRWPRLWVTTFAVLLLFVSPVTAASPVTVASAVLPLVKFRFVTVIAPAPAAVPVTFATLKMASTALPTVIEETYHFLVVDVFIK